MNATKMKVLLSVVPAARRKNKKVAAVFTVIATISIILIAVQARAVFTAVENCDDGVVIGP